MRRFFHVCLAITLMVYPFFVLQQNHWFETVSVKAQASLPPFNKAYNFTASGTKPTGPPAYEDVTGRAISVWRLDWRYNGTTVPSACTATLEGSNDGVVWTTGVITGTCTTNGQSSLTQANYNFLRVNVTTLTLASAGSLDVNLTGYNDYIGITSGGITDPCWGLAATTVSISIATSTKLIPASSGKKNTICSGILITAIPVSASIVEGTGTLCGTNTVAIIGATTAASGLPLAANEGFQIPRSIFGTGTNVDTCWLQNNTSQVSGYITEIQQ